MTIPLDVLTANKSQDWVDGFFWPVNSLDLLTVRKEIEGVLYSVLQKEADELLLSAMRVTFNRLVVENLSLTNALLVLNGFRSSGCGVDASHQSGKYGLLKGVAETGAPAKPIFLPDLLERRTLRRYARSLLNSSKRNMSRILNGDYSILMCNGLAEDVSAASAKTFLWMDRYDFFSKLTFDVYNGNGNKAAGLAEKVTGEILKYWDSRQISAGQPMKEYLYDYHYKNFFRTSCFLNSTRNAGILKNRNVWTGAGGVYFYRLICEMAKKQGGHVSCHDHAESKALYDTTVHGYSELGLCDRYVTYTRDCVELYEKGWKNNAVSLYKKMPEVEVNPVGCGRYYNSLVTKNRHKGIRIKSRKVIYVSGGFDNDLNFYANRPHDMVYFEWQNWMLKAIKEMGYSIGVKYHPETMVLESNVVLGDSVEYLKGFFQEYVDREDILIFDTTCSTALQIALCGSNPMMLIYCPVNEIHDSVIEDLAGRVEIVRGFFDEKNRFRVDLNALASAIEKCDKNKGYDFVKKYIVEF